MSNTHYDLVVLGWGKAGKTLAMKRAKAGDRVALIEKSPTMYGGTCINIGCVPTKSFVTSAHRYALTHEGEETPGGYREAQAKRHALINKLNNANHQMALDAGVEAIDGTGRFVGPREIEITKANGDVSRVSADKIVISTGSTPNIPPIDGIDSPRVVDSTGIQFLDDAPARLVVIGGGPIGLEFASLFNEFGSKVTVIDTAERAFTRYDADIASAAQSVMESKGVTFVVNAQITSITDEAGAARVSYTVDGAAHSVEADTILLSAGRRPATEGLNLEAAGIEVGSRGEVVVDEYLRTSAEGVWATGDVNGGPQFTYVSFDDHRIVLPQLAGDEPTRSTKGRVIPTTTFIEPPLATVGLSEEEARDTHRVRIAKKEVAKIAAMPRPKILGQPEGVIKFVIDEETDKILGASLFVIDAQELINLVAVAISQGMTAADLAGTIFTHPSSTEAFNEVLG